MSDERSRVVRAMWWILAVTPAISFAIQLSTGYIAHSADEAYGGLGPDGLLVIIAAVLSMVLLVRLVGRWRRTERQARVEALTLALATIPLVITVGGIAELVGWPHTRTAGASRFIAGAAIVIGWTAVVLFARHRLRVREARAVEIRGE